MKKTAVQKMSRKLVRFVILTFPSEVSSKRQICRRTKWQWCSQWDTNTHTYVCS